MNGIPYKDTFAAKGSQLHTALIEKRDADAKRIYAETSARSHALLHGLAVPTIVHELGEGGKHTGKWSIRSTDALYDNNGRFKEKRNASK